MHCTHSILAGRMDTNEAKAGKTSLGLYCFTGTCLASIAAIQFTDTSKNSVRGEYLKELCERGILQRLPYAGPRTTFSRTIDFEKLQQELGRSPQVENQTADSQNSECPESESQPPTVQNQNTYIDTTPIHHYLLHKRQPMLCKKRGGCRRTDRGYTCQ